MRKVRTYPVRSSSGRVYGITGHGRIPYIHGNQNQPKLIHHNREVYSFDFTEGRRYFEAHGIKVTPKLEVDAEALAYHTHDPLGKTRTERWRHVTPRPERRALFVYETLYGVKPWVDKEYDQREFRDKQVAMLAAPSVDIRVRKAS